MTLTASLVFLASGAHLRQGGGILGVGPRDGARSDPASRFASVLNVVLRPRWAGGQTAEVYQRIEKNFFGTVFVCPETQWGSVPPRISREILANFSAVAPTLPCDGFAQVPGDKSYLALGPLLAGLHSGGHLEGGVASKTHDQGGE